MKLKKITGQCFKAGLLWIESDFDGFGMTSILTTDLLIGGGLEMSSNKTNPGANYAWLLLQKVLFTPKAAGRKSSYASFFLG